MASSKLAGRVALVTGASRGIGEAIARRFAAEGALVGITARTREEGDHRFSGSIATTLATIRDAGGTAIAVAADLSRDEDRVRLVETVSGELGPIDVLVNNAAITYFGPSSEFDLRRYQLMFDVQVLAPFHLSQLVAPAMRAAQRGWILNISSPAAVHPTGPPFVAGGHTVYGMCKAALERFSSGLASELYEDGISVNALSPTGLVVTPGVVHHESGQADPEGATRTRRGDVRCGTPALLTGATGAHGPDRLVPVVPPRVRRGARMRQLTAADVPSRSWCTRGARTGRRGASSMTHPPVWDHDAGRSGPHGLTPRGTPQG
jgi:citronellol/citronellal dehydrogenase